jgi:peroxiredoxin Q/BCP
MALTARRDVRKKILGTIRSTYLIDENGRVDAVWSKVKVDGHVDRVLEHLRGAEPRPPKKASKKK